MFCSNGTELIPRFCLGFAPDLTSRRHTLRKTALGLRGGWRQLFVGMWVKRPLVNCNVYEQPEEAPSRGQALGRAGV